MLEKKAKMLRASGLSSTERYSCVQKMTGSDKVALARMKNELDKSERELSSIVSSAYSITSSFFRSTNALLDSAFTHLLSSLHTPATTALSPAVHHNYKPSYDLESLLSSAFRTATPASTHLSQSASVAEPPMPSVSFCGSLADRDSVQDHLNDIPTGIDTPMQDPLNDTPTQDLLADTPTQDLLADIPAGIDASPRDAELPLSSDRRLTLESNADSTAELARASPKPLFAHHARLLCVSQHTARSEELLPEAGYDVVSVAVHPSFLLLLTSRGNVLSLPRDAAPPLASGLATVSLSAPPTPTLIPSLQLERAIRNKRFVAVACGASFALALASSGEVYAWGEGKRGELGLGDITERAQPEVAVGVRREA